MKNSIVCIGVNKLDTAYYRSQLHELSCCNQDAKDVFDYFTEKYKFQSEDLFTDCNSRVLVSHLEYLADLLEPGDNLILFYSGHGGQVDDYNGDETDDFDETWCLKDRQLIDDEIFNTFAKFKKDVNILVLSDSCHSGSVVRALDEEKENQLSKRVSYKKSQALFDLNRQKHKNIFAIKLVDEDAIDARVVLISGCQDEESSYAGDPNSQFTEVLLNILKAEEDKINLKSLFKAIRTNLKDYPYQQTPNIQVYGKINSEFLTTPIDTLLKSDDLPPAKTPAGAWERTVFIEGNFKGKGLEEVKTADFVFESSEGDGEDQIYTFKITNPTIENGWQAAHLVYEELIRLNINSAVYPVINFDHPDIQSEFAKSTETDLKSFLNSWPPHVNNIKNPFNWYKKLEYSQLEDALNEVIDTVDKEQLNIKIAHIDSGYLPDHPSTPENVNADESRSFIKGEKDNKGTIVLSSKGQAQHGIGTLAILAGKKVKPEEKIFQQFEGEMGAIPFAEVVCLRIADKVHFTNGKVLKAFTKAVNYAVDKGCKVITMSMGGLSSKGMARAVNRAYENGVVFVSAAGNNFNTWWDFAVPEQLVYPARYDRVIAATGATYNYKPYDFAAQADFAKGGFNGDRMQGNSGPPDKMYHAIAAFTPNVPWAGVILDHENKVRKHIFSPKGGGTSSATPQVASAVALWLVMHQDELKKKGYWNNWKCVEAVKHALRKSADNTTYEHSDQYYGMGILQALKALKIGVKDISNGMMAAPAKKRGIFSLFKGEDAGAMNPHQEMIESELEYILSLDKRILQGYQSGNLTRAEVENWIKNNPLSSEALKATIK